jgi:hypothetical protein
MFIGMQASTAYSIARRWPVEEFGYHVSATRDVPCSVASSVADAGGQAWAHWSGNDGVVGVRPTGYTAGPYLGRFSCTGWQGGRGTHETCHHSADGHAGAITVRFLITDNPNYSG